jgi:hypothetical protein
MTSADFPGGSATAPRTPAPDQRCSVLSERALESTYGTATPAVVWVALEQPGPWGREAVVDSHLGRDVGEALGSSVKAVGGRLAMIRRPGPHPDDRRRHPRRLLVASCRPNADWLVAADVVDLRQLMSVDYSAAAAGDVSALLRSLPDGHLDPRAQLLVCTNGRRDVCCAVRGRPVAEGVAQMYPGQVWETSHTGGHRFAPTAVLLPSGLMFGRISVGAAGEALREVEAGSFPSVWLGPRHDRGRSALTAPAQVAESVVRHRDATSELGALSVVARPLVASPGSVTDVSEWRVSHIDGRWWDVSVRRVASGPPRPVSCGRPAEPQFGYDAGIKASGHRRRTAPQ